MSEWASIAAAAAVPPSSLTKRGDLRDDKVAAAAAAASLVWLVSAEGEMGRHSEHGQESGPT